MIARYRRLLGLGEKPLSRNARLLMAARAARSVAQGALIVDFALYLRALGWTPAVIGLVFTAGIATDALLALTVGPLSDQFGRRRFLLGYEAIQGCAAVCAVLTTNGVALAAAAILGGLGRGVSGSSGPFSPVELSWLAQSISHVRHRGPIYSLNAAIGFVGTGIGALLGGAPGLLGHWLNGPQAYKPLFGLALISAATCCGLLFAARDKPAVRESATAGNARQTTRNENILLAKLLAINALNGASRGMIGPLMTYWFAIRFGHGPASIGPVVTLAYFITAVSSLSSAPLIQRLGVVSSVVWMRIAGLLFLVLIPLVPDFWLAAVFYIARSAFNRGTIGARQALTVGLVRPHRQGTAVSLGNVAGQLPRALGPLLAGLLFTAGWLELPFYVAAVFSGLHIYFYKKAFGRLG